MPQTGAKKLTSGPVSSKPGPFVTRQNPPYTSGCRRDPRAGPSLCRRDRGRAHNTTLPPVAIACEGPKARLKFDLVSGSAHRSRLHSNKPRLVAKCLPKFPVLYRVLRSSYPPLGKSGFPWALDTPDSVQTFTPNNLQSDSHDPPLNTGISGQSEYPEVNCCSTRSLRTTPFRTSSPEPPNWDDSPH